MKKFKFRLEQVLRFKHLLKEDKRRELLLKTQILRDSERRLETLLEEELSNQIGEDRVFRAEDLNLIERYAIRLNNEITNQRLIIIKAEEELEKAITEYIEAAKEHKMIDTLKQKRRDEYVEEVAREDTKILDELAIQRNRLVKAR